MNIATLGPRGTYSEAASRLLARRHSVPNPSIIYTTVDGALKMVQNREADYAVVAIENTLDGHIGSTLDSLIEYQDFVKVCDEVFIEITHCLLASPGASFMSIQTVYSHATALNQCTSTLADRLPKAIAVPTASTADAARLVAERGSDLSLAAIGSAGLAEEHNLVILSRDIQDYKQNSTRFVVCSLTDSAITSDAKTMMAIRPGRDMPGLLYNILGELADKGLNLTYIQSRPYKVRPSEYVFMLEVEGHKSEAPLAAALKSIDRYVREGDGWKKVLGSFPKRGIEHY